MQTATHVLWSGLWGVSDPILLLWCPLNSCLCISSLLSHKRCSGLFMSSSFLTLFFWHFLFFISYFLPLCCPCPFMTPTSHIPLLKDGGGALWACVYHLDAWSVKALNRFCPLCASRPVCPPAIVLPVRLYSPGLFLRIQIQSLVQAVWSFSVTLLNPPQSCKCEILGHPVHILYPSIACSFVCFRQNLCCHRFYF